MVIRDCIVNDTELLVYLEFKRPQLLLKHSETNLKRTVREISANAHPAKLWSTLGLKWLIVPWLASHGCHGYKRTQPTTVSLKNSKCDKIITPNWSMRHRVNWELKQINKNITGALPVFNNTMHKSQQLSQNGWWVNKIITTYNGCTRCNETHIGQQQPLCAIYGSDTSSIVSTSHSAHGGNLVGIQYVPNKSHAECGTS